MMIRKYWIVIICLTISIVSNAQKIQFLDARGKAISQEKFSDFYSSPTNFTIVKKGDLFGVLDTKKGLIINCEYEEIKNNKVYTNIFSVKKDGNWGIMNATGETLLPIQYEEIKSFDEELAIVSIDFYWVLVNYKGEKLVEGEYEDASNLNNSEGIWFQKKGEYKLFNRSGKELYTQTGWVSLDNVTGEHLQTVSNGWHKTGLFDMKTEKVVVPLAYDNVKVIKDDLIEVAKCRIEYDGFGPSPRPDDFYYGIYSVSLQKEIVPCTYDKIEVTKEYIKAKINGNGDYYSHQGKVLNPENLKPSTDLNDFGYEIVIPAFDDIYVIKRTTGRYKWGILNYENNEFEWLEFLSGYYDVDDFEFIQSGETTFPLILINSYNGTKIYDRNGKVIHQTKYPKMDKIKTTSSYIVYRNYDPKKGLVTHLMFVKDGSIKELSDYNDKDFIMPFKNDAGQYGLKKLDGTIVEAATHKSIEMNKYGDNSVFIVKD